MSCLLVLFLCSTKALGSLQEPQRSAQESIESKKCTSDKTSTLQNIYLAIPFTLLYLLQMNSERFPTIFEEFNHLLCHVNNNNDFTECLLYNALLLVLSMSYWWEHHRITHFTLMSSVKQPKNLAYVIPTLHMRKLMLIL